MNRLQMATLLSWADDHSIQGRKRMQKVVYFLQYAGCPLDCQYTLHHFGPYSRDVAEVCDEMVAAGLIEEHSGPNSSYSYKLAHITRDYLADVEDDQMHHYEQLVKRLIKESLLSLELGSTILYFYAQSNDWEDALSNACGYKKKNPEDASSQTALGLAKQIATRK